MRGCAEGVVATITLTVSFVVDEIADTTWA